MRAWYTASLAVALALGSGCTSSPPVHKLAWRTLSRGLTSGMSGPYRAVIREEVDFLALWAEHAAEARQVAMPPTVDFSREMVVVVALGTKPTGGYLVEIVDLELKRHTLRVLVSERSPDPETIQIQRQTQPYQMIALPAIAADVRFRNVRESGRTGARRDTRPGDEGSSPRPKPPPQPAPSPRGAASMP